MKSKNTTLNTITETAEELFKFLDIPVELEIEKIEENTFSINVQTENTGLLIGFHGETLSALQLLLSLMIYKKLGSWVHASLNVGNYREYREEQIKNLVNRVIEQVKQTGQPQGLPFLSGTERRVVHLYLVDNPDVISESEGEGRNRRIFIKPKIDTTVSS